MCNRNARPNNNQVITYYLPVCYLLRIQQYVTDLPYEKNNNHKFYLQIMGAKNVCTF